MKAVVLDAWAWFEVFHGTATGRAIAATYPPNLRRTSAAAVAEVASRLHRHGTVQQADAAVDAMRAESTIIPVDDDIAMLAGQLHKHLRGRDRDASLVDAIHLATARTLGIPLVSADPCFKGEPDVIQPGRP